MCAVPPKGRDHPGRRGHRQIDEITDTPAPINGLPMTRCGIPVPTDVAVLSREVSVRDVHLAMSRTGQVARDEVSVIGVVKDESRGGGDRPRVEEFRHGGAASSRGVRSPGRHVVQAEVQCLN